MMRSIWKGSISFGLVNIPINMYVASQAKEISFVLLHKKDMSEIRYARICKTEDKEVPWEEIVKGYELEKGDFVIFDEKDFEKASLKKTKSIELVGFVEEDEIDTMYYVKPYFLEPGKNADKAYGLLRDALRKSKKVGLASFVLRNKEHIAVIKPYENLLILNELRYQTELLRADDLNVSPLKTNSKELDMAIQLIDQMKIPFDPEKYKDTYTEELKQMIDQKAKGKPIHPKTKEAPSPKIHDIMSLLKASLDKKPDKAKKPKITKTA